MNIVLMVNGVKKDFSLLQYELELRLVIRELEEEKCNQGNIEILNKAKIEHRNICFFLNGLISHEDFITYLEIKDFSKYDETRDFLNGNSFSEFPILYMIYTAGVPLNTLIKCLGVTRRQIDDQMKENGLVVGILNMDLVLTTLEYHPYNHYDFYIENRSIAEKLAKEMLKKKVFRSKISALTGLTYVEIDNLLKS